MSKLSVMSRLNTIRSITPEDEKRLSEAKINSTEELMQACSTKKGRTNLSKETMIDESTLSKWINLLDLTRIKGVGMEYAELLEESGVDTTSVLARRNAHNLLEKMTMVNDSEKIVRRLPTQSQIENWIEQAKELPKMH